MGAVKVQGQACYFSLEVPFHCLLGEDGKLEKQDYLAKWGQLGDANERKFSVTGVNGGGKAAVAVLAANNIFDVATRQADGNEITYSSMKFINGLEVLIELTFPPGSTTAGLAVKTTTADLFAVTHNMIQEPIGAAAPAP